MKRYFPAYYKEFRCIAADCPDSCCKEWTVDVDPESARRYRALEGDLGDRLRAVLEDTDDGAVMTIENGRCPMWRQDGLCRIQAELGHDALCQTCRDFPRLRHDYGDFVELGLELSCPEAAKLIFASPAQLLAETVSGGDEPEYDASVMALLKSSRAQVLSVLEGEAFSLQEALAVLLLHAHDVQGQMDGFEAVPFEPELLLLDAKKYAAQGDMEGFFRFFQGLEILTDAWASRLAQGPAEGRLSDALWSLARYMVNRYWLQAVSDLDLLSRAKFVVIACILVGALGGDPVQTAQLFSKEIENDPDNVEAILEGAYTSPALTDTNLLSLLLGIS